MKKTTEVRLTDPIQGRRAKTKAEADRIQAANEARLQKSLKVEDSP